MKRYAIVQNCCKKRTHRVNVRQDALDLKVRKKAAVVTPPITCTRQDLRQTISHPLFGQALRCADAAGLPNVHVVTRHAVIRVQQHFAPPPECRLGAASPPVVLFGAGHRTNRHAPLTACPISYRSRHTAARRTGTITGGNCGGARILISTRRSPLPGVAGGVTDVKRWAFLPIFAARPALPLQRGKGRKVLQTQPSGYPSSVNIVYKGYAP